MQTVLRRLQWRQLQLIDTIGETGQISVAAERLGMAQPSASRSLATVEDEIGLPLFYRRPNGMVPTPLGEVMLRHTKALLQNLDDTVSEIDAFVKGRSGSVRVGSVTGAALAYVVPAARRLNEETEGADIYIDVAPSELLTRGLKNGEFDFVLARLPGDGDTRSLQFFGGRVELVQILVRRGHPLTRMERVDVGDLPSYGWIVQSPGSPVREAMEEALVSAGAPLPEKIVNTSSLLVTIAYLRDTDHIAPVSSEVAAIIAGDEDGPFARISLARDIIVYPYHLLQSEGRTLSPLAQRMRQLISEAMAKG